MIHTIRKGTSFRRAIFYNARKADFIGGNMFFEEPEVLVRQLEEHMARFEVLPEPVFHGMIRARPGEHLAELDWLDVADRYMDHLGYRYAPYAVYLEETPEGSHVHIVGARRDHNGKVVDDFRDYIRGQYVMRQVERAYGLEPVRSSWEVGIRAPTGDELKASLRTGVPSVRMQLQERVLEAVEASETVTELVAELKDRGVVLGVRFGRDGETVRGLTYALDDERMRASDLGRKLTFGGLTADLRIDYQPERDRLALRETALRYARRFEDTDHAREALRGVIAAAASGKPEVRVFVERLAFAGVTAVPHVSESGRVFGLAYRLDGVEHTGSALGKPYTWKGLQRWYGVGFEPERDVPFLRAWRDDPDSVEVPEVEDLRGFVAAKSGARTLPAAASRPAAPPKLPPSPRHSMISMRTFHRVLRDRRTADMAWADEAAFRGWPVERITAGLLKRSGDGGYSRILAQAAVAAATGEVELPDARFQARLTVLVRHSAETGKTVPHAFEALMRDGFGIELPRPLLDRLLKEVEGYGGPSPLPIQEVPPGFGHPAVRELVQLSSELRGRAFAVQGDPGPHSLGPYYGALRQFQRKAAEAEKILSGLPPYSARRVQATRAVALEAHVRVLHERYFQSVEELESAASRLAADPTDETLRAFFIARKRSQGLRERVAELPSVSTPLGSSAQRFEAAEGQARDALLRGAYWRSRIAVGELEELAEAGEAEATSATTGEARGRLSARARAGLRDFQDGELSLTQARELLRDVAPAGPEQVSAAEQNASDLDQARDNLARAERLGEEAPEAPEVARERVALLTEERERLASAGAKEETRSAAEGLEARLARAEHRLVSRELLAEAQRLEARPEDSPREYYRIRRQVRAAEGRLEDLSGRVEERLDQAERELARSREAFWAPRQSSEGLAADLGHYRDVHQEVADLERLASRPGPSSAAVARVELAEQTFDRVQYRQSAREMVRAVEEGDLAAFRKNRRFFEAAEKRLGLAPALREHQVPALRRRIEQLSERIHAAEGEVSPRVARSLLRSHRYLAGLEERIGNGAAPGDLGPNRGKALSAFYRYSQVAAQGHLKGLDAAVNDRSFHVPEPERHQLVRREVVPIRDHLQALEAGPDAKAAVGLRERLAGLELTHVTDQARRLELRVEPDGREEGIEKAAWHRERRGLDYQVREIASGTGGVDLATLEAEHRAAVRAKRQALGTYRAEPTPEGLADLKAAFETERQTRAALDEAVHEKLKEITPQADHTIEALDRLDLQRAALDLRQVELPEPAQEPFDRLRQVRPILQAVERLTEQLDRQGAFPRDLPGLEPALRHATATLDGLSTEAYEKLLETARATLTDPSQLGRFHAAATALEQVEAARTSLHDRVGRRFTSASPVPHRLRDLAQKLEARLEAASVALSPRGDPLQALEARIRAEVYTAVRRLAGDKGLRLKPQTVEPIERLLAQRREVWATLRAVPENAPARQALERAASPVLDSLNAELRIQLRAIHRPHELKRLEQAVHWAEQRTLRGYAIEEIRRHIAPDLSPDQARLVVGRAQALSDHLRHLRRTGAIPSKSRMAGFLKNQALRMVLSPEVKALVGLAAAKSVVGVAYSVYKLVKSAIRRMERERQKEVSRGREMER